MVHAHLLHVLKSMVLSKWHTPSNCIHTANQNRANHVSQVPHKAVASTIFWSLWHSLISVWCKGLQALRRMPSSQSGSFWPTSLRHQNIQMYNLPFYSTVELAVYLSGRPYSPWHKSTRREDHYVNGIWCKTKLLNIIVLEFMVNYLQGSLTLSQSPLRIFYSAPLSVVLIFPKPPLSPLFTDVWNKFFSWSLNPD